MLTHESIMDASKLYFPYARDYTFSQDRSSNIFSGLDIVEVNGDLQLQRNPNQENRLEKSSLEDKTQWLIISNFLDNCISSGHISYCNWISREFNHWRENSIGAMIKI